MKSQAVVPSLGVVEMPPGSLQYEVDELVRAVESLRAEEEKAMNENELLVEELGENLDKKSVSSLQYVGPEPE